MFLGFPWGSAGKDSTCNAGDLGSFPGLGRYPGEGKGYLLQYSGLENSMDCIIHGVAKSRTRRNYFNVFFLLDEEQGRTRSGGTSGLYNLGSLFKKKNTKLRMQ